MVAVADARISNQIKDTLASYADEVLLLPPHPALSGPVASHPDMLLWRCGKRTVTYRHYLSVAPEVFSALAQLGYEILAEENPPLDVYPKDVSLNCAVTGVGVIAHRKYISPTVREVAHRTGLDVLHVNQGYAKCSTVTVSPTAIITADPCVYATALQNGLDALKVREGHVRLDGYETGFLGGATGVTGTYVLFCGNLDYHPDADAIKQFCEEHGKTAVSLSDEPLYDYGTVLFF